MNVLYIVIFVLACALILLLGCFIKRKFDSDRGKNVKCETTKESYEKKIEKTNKTIKFMEIIVIILSISSIILFWVHPKGYKAIVIAQIKAADKDENFDPKLLCEQEQKIPEDESVQNDAEKPYYDLLNCSWFEEVGNSKDEYITKIKEWLNGREMITDSSVDRLQGEQKDRYEANKSEIDDKESSKVSEEGGESELKQLTAEEYMKEYALRMDCFAICSTADMLQQASKAALDVETVLNKSSDDWDTIAEYAGHGIQGYADLMFYVSSDESKTDCCYWIAKTYKDLAENIPGEYWEYEQHCYLMAFAFADVGESYAQTETRMSDHADELTKIKRQVENTLART